MESLKYTILIFFILLFAMNTLTSDALEPALPQIIGEIVWVKNTLKAQQPNAEIRTLTRRSPVYEHDTLTTEANSAGEIVFTDDSELALQENSTIQIDHYNHCKDNAPNKEAFVVNVVKGGFRTITGAISKNNPGGYKATTPVATIGVAGTMYSVYFDLLKKSMAAKLDKGSIVISNEQGSVTLAHCGSASKAGTGSANCVNTLYAKVDGTNTAPQTVTKQPTVFNIEPPLTITNYPKANASGLVGSFCIN